MNIEEIKKQAELAKEVQALTELKFAGGIDKLSVKGDWKYSGELRVEPDNHRLVKFLVEVVLENEALVLKQIKKKNLDDFVAMKESYKAELDKVKTEVDNIS